MQHLLVAHTHTHTSRLIYPIVILPAAIWTLPIISPNTDRHAHTEKERVLHIVVRILNDPG